MTIAGRIEVKFDGVYLFYGMPKAVEFEGLIRFIKEAQIIGFAGDMALRVPASGFAAEAGLLVGMNFEDPPYPFLYLYFGVELPTGIPLGQSGLALKGALGLFGLNVSPDKAPEQNWYYDWYKRQPVGAQPTNKWRNERHALALGVGVTITTTDGYIKGTRGLLVLAVPGPILILEGRALILNGLVPNSEPPLRALAVFDGREQIVQFNIEAEAEIVEDMLEAYGGLEAFFDFNDLTNWHLYLGQDQPLERRIQANFLKFGSAFLFKADAYLMIDMIGSQTLRSRMGVFIGFKPKIPAIGPVNVVFDATLTGDGVATILPEQFSGTVELAANLELSFGIGLQMTANADVLAEGPKPLRVEAYIDIHAELPLPPLEIPKDVPFVPDDVSLKLPPLVIEEELHFVWEQPEPPTITPPLADVAVNSRFAPGGGALEVRRQTEPLESLQQDLAEASPVVPLDGQLILGFHHEMNQPTDSPFARHPDGEPKYYDVGPVRFTPTLVKINLYEHRKADPWTGDANADWSLIASSDISQNLPMPGVWLADSDPQKPTTPAARRLQLWTDNPLNQTGAALEATYSLILGTTGANKPLAEQVLDSHPNLMLCDRVEPEEICVDFTRVAEMTIPANTRQVYRRLRYHSDHDITVDGQRCLSFIGQKNSILFPQSVVRVRIRFCRTLESPKIDTRRRPNFTERAAMTAGTTEPPSDFRDCPYPIAYDLQVQDSEWIVEAKNANEGFDCLTIYQGSETQEKKELIPEEFAIEEICYLTLAEVQRAARAAEQCGQKPYPPDSIPPLQPGSYYRLEVETQLEVDIPPENLPPLPSPLDDALFNLYKDMLTAHLGFPEEDSGASDSNFRPQIYHDAAFFQTEGPPHNLSRYLKWTSPAHQAVRVFRDNDFVVRFLRSNVHYMYELPSHQLRILIRSAEGHLVDGYQIERPKARSATLFPEEAAWYAHRRILEEAPHNWPEAELPNDDVLEAQRGKMIPGLRPGARYEMLIAGGEGGEALPLTWQAAEAGWSDENGNLKRGTAQEEILLAGNQNWRDLEFAVEVNSAAGEALGLVVRAFKKRQPKEGEPIWQAYRLVFSPGTANAHLELLARESSGSINTSVLTTFQVNLTPGHWSRVRVVVIGDQLQAWLFDQAILDVKLTQRQAQLIDDSVLDIKLARPIFEGGVGLYAAGAQTVFRNTHVYSAILHSVSFTTSAFQSFSHLVKSFQERAAIPLKLAKAIPSDATNKLQETAPELARRLWQWHRDQVDYQFETLPGGREALENSRLTLREARANHDEAFRALADPLGDLFYQPLTPQLEVFALQAPGNNTQSSPSGFWLRSPESLDLWMDVIAAEGESLIGHVGRTRLALQFSRSDQWQEITFRLFYDTDSTQLLLLPPAGALWPSGTYRLSFSYYWGHGDEESDDNHRYDRPVEKQLGTESPQRVYITWTISPLQFSQ